MLKKRQMKKCFIIFLLWVIPMLSSAQVDTVFWFVAPEVTQGHADRPINLVVSSTQELTPTNVTITMPQQPSFTPINITLTGYETHLEDLEPRINLIESITSGIVDNKGILIRADAPITAYYEVDPSNNRDIYSLKGENALGYEFFCPIQNEYNNHNGLTPPARNRIDVVAAENGTIVTFQITAAANGLPAGSTITTPVMQAGETYSVVADSRIAANHLGGTKVTSNNKLIAVTLSDDSVDDPSAGHYDLLGDQLVPVQTPGAGGEYTIGYDFIVIKTRLSIDEHYFIVATDGATNVQVDGVDNYTVNPWQTLSIVISGDTDYITCDKRVYLFHVGGFQREMGGALLPTIDGCKGSTRVSFTRTSGAPFYINLLVEGDSKDAFYMEYEDGSVYQIPPGNFTQVPNMPVGEEWYYLDRGANDFPDAQSPGVPNGEVTTIYNTETIFQMGLYNGTSGTGCKYGYFSDFKTNESSAVASGTNSDLIELCYGDSTYIRASGGINYQWTSTTCTDCMEGDLTSESIKVIPPPGSHVFYVEISNPCKLNPDTAKVTVNVDSLIKAYYTTSESLIACDSISVATTNNTIGERDGFQWYLDGAAYSTSSEPVLNYKNTGAVPDTVPITLAAYRYLCADAFTRNAIVYPSINADFEPIDTAGCSPFAVPFNNTTPTLGNAYKWNFGDGNLAFTENPQNTYTNSTTANQFYNVEMVATSSYNCKDTANQSVTIFPPVTSDFFINKTSGCAPLEVNVTNLSSMATIDSIQWVWGDGDTAFIENPGTHTYQNTTAANITRTLDLEVYSNNGCSHISSVSITVYPQVSAGFDQDLTNICHSTMVSFQDTSIGPIASKKWNFSDGTVYNNIGDTTHIFQNFSNTDSTFTVYQIVQNATGCSDTASIDINVHPGVFAGFSTNKIKGCADLDLTFIDQAMGPIAGYEWDWGDGSPLEVGSGPLNHTYINNTSNSLFRTSQQVVSNAAGCSDTAQQQIEVYPIADATFTAAPITGCNPLDVIFTHTPGNLVSVSRNWDFGDNSSSSALAPVHTFQHFNNISTPFLVELSVQTDKGCTDTANVTINVGPYIEVGFTIDTAQGCSPFTITPQNTSSGGIDSWTWKKEDIVISNVQNSGPITFFNNGDTPIDTTITLIGTNSAGACIDSMQRTITIYPAVYANFTQDINQGCNPLTVQFTHNSPNNPSMSYNWNFGDNNSSSTKSPSHTFNNIDPAPRIYDVKLIVTSPYNCADSSNSTVTAGSYFDARMQASQVSGCSPFQVQFTDISDGNVTARTWYRNGTSFSNISNPQIIITNTSGAIRYDTITMVARSTGTFTCYDTAQKIIAVYPELDPSFSHAVIEGCNPLAVNFTHAASTYDYFWDFGDNSSSNLESPSHTFINDQETIHNYSIKLVVESEYGCKDSSFSQVNVASRLNAEFTMPAAAGCSPFTANFTDASEGDIATRQWFIDGTLASTTNIANTTMVNTSNNNLVHDVKLIVTNTGPGTCVDSITKQITAYPEVTADFIMDIDRGCNPLPVNFTYQPGGNTLNVNFDWDFGDNTSSDEQDPPHTFEHFNYNGTSSFEVWLTTTSDYGCTAQHQQVVTVERALNAEFTTDPSAGCNPFSAEFINVSKGADTYEWTYGDGINYSINLPQNVTHDYTNNSYANTANYTAKLVVSNTGGVCFDSMQQQIKVYPQINASFNASTLEDCHPVEVAFTNLSQGVSQYSWDFADETNSSQVNPIHTFRNPSNTVDLYFDVNLKTSNSYECIDDTTITIRVNHKPRSQFTIDQTASCSPLQILATNTAIGYDNYTWRTGDGQTSVGNPLSYTYNNTSGQTESYELELYTATNKNCKDSTSLILNVYPLVTADFNITTPEGCNPLTTDFVNTSTSTDNYFWDFGNGSTSNQTNPSNRFAITGFDNETIPVKLVASSSFECVDSITKNVTVYVQPRAEFEVDPTTQQFTNDNEAEVTITDLTNGGPFNYSWSFGDGETSNVTNSTSHIYDSWGDFKIDLEVTNMNYNCVDSASETIIIYPPEVIASFDIIDTAGCAPHTTTFTAVSSEFSGEAYEFYWDFGDETESNEQNPTHTFISAGVYPITLTVTGDNGTMNAFATVSVYQVPVVNFTMEPRFLMIPGDVAQCYNLTQYADSATTYLWEFGDGSSSTEKNPTQQYTEQGVYDITLTATSGFGCIADTTKENYIEVQGKGALKFPNAFTPSLAGPSNGTYNPNSTNNDIFFPIAQGVTQYSLVVYNRWGELMFQSKDVNKGWDGYYNGKICPQDVYIWKVEGKFKNGKTFEQTGDVTLLR